jgi:Fur family ferric uptake transcriptional regulator
LIFVILSAAKSGPQGWSDIHFDVRTMGTPRISCWILRSAQNDKFAQARPNRPTTGVNNALTAPRVAPECRAVSIPAAREVFRKFLTQKGLRVTSQRLAIFDAAFAQKDHFTAEQLLDYARVIDDSVSRATVYRTLPIMTESALLREVDIGSGEKFYRPNESSTANAQVAQVVCLDCEKIFEISAPFMSWYGNTVSSKLGLTPVSQRLQVSAQCDLWRKTGTCPRHG